MPVPRVSDGWCSAETLVDGPTDHRGGNLAVPVPRVSGSQCSPGTHDMRMRGMWHADHVGLCGVGAYYFKLSGKLERMASGLGVESFD